MHSFESKNEINKRFEKLEASSASHTELIEANAIINNELLGYYERNYKELSELKNMVITHESVNKEYAQLINKDIKELKELIGGDDIKFDDTIKGMVLTNLARINELKGDLQEFIDFHWTLESEGQTHEEDLTFEEKYNKHAELSKKLGRGDKD